MIASIRPFGRERIEVSWSNNEVRALAVKAARGAGMHWGVAEEAGYAAFWLQFNGLPGVSALAGYLSSASSEELASANSDTCPIRAGIRISDGVDDSLMTDVNLHYPLLVLPFLVHAVPGVISLKFSEIELIANVNGVAEIQPGANFLVPSANVSTRSLDVDITYARKQTRTPDKEAEAIAVLTEFAGKTYAPATEESRLMGAGAGLNDND